MLDDNNNDNNNNNDNTLWKQGKSFPLILILVPLLVRSSYSCFSLWPIEITSGLLCGTFTMVGSSSVVLWLSHRLYIVCGSPKYCCAVCFLLIDNNVMYL